MKLRKKPILHIVTFLFLVIVSNAGAVEETEVFEPKEYLEKSKETYLEAKSSIEIREQEQLSGKEKKELSALDTKNKSLYEKVEEFYGPYEEAKTKLNTATTDVEKVQAQKEVDTAAQNIQANAEQIKTVIEPLLNDVQTGLDALQAALGVVEAPVEPSADQPASEPSASDESGEAGDPAEEKETGGGGGGEPEEEQEDPFIEALSEIIIEAFSMLFFSQWFKDDDISLPEFFYKLYKLLSGDIEIDWSELTPVSPGEFPPPTDGGITLQAADAMNLLYNLQQIESWIATDIASAFKNNSKLTKSDIGWMKRYNKLFNKIEILDVTALSDIAAPETLPQGIQEPLIRTIIKAVNNKPALSWLSGNDQSSLSSGVIPTSISQFDLVKAMRTLTRLESAFLDQIYAALQPSGLTPAAQAALQNLADLLVTLSSKISRKDPTVLSNLSSIEQKIILYSMPQLVPSVTAPLA